LRKQLLGRYASLQNPPSAENLDARIVGIPSEGSNDWVDNQLIAALVGDLVDYLVTDDMRIHSKARRLDLSSRVLFLNDAVALLRDLFDEIPSLPPAVVDMYVYELDNNDPIFNSLRGDYKDFDSWLIKCKREQRRALVIRDSNHIAGLSILKREDKLPDGTTGRTLKMCTFKVDDNYAGQRFGELLLKTVFDYVAANNYMYTYFTAYPRQERLVEFAEDFGFREVENKDSKEELALVKEFVPSEQEVASLSPLDLHIKYGPRITGFTGNWSFVIPIQPFYHKVLFPEFEKQRRLIPDTRPCGNSIKKAYLSHSKSTSIGPGDNIFIYRSHDTKGITGLGIVEGVIRSERANEIARYVGSRTVYSYSEIEAMCKKPVLAINFRLVRLFDEAISLSDVFAGAPQSITKLDGEKLQWLRKQITM
jgi:GNAT superfamily N-acetyltransferase